MLCALIAGLVGPLAPGVRASREPAVPAPPASPRLPAPPAHVGAADGGLEASPAASTTRPRWKRRIDKLVKGRAIGVAVHVEGEILYEWGAKRRRAPASNEKLLTSMVLLETFDRTDRLSTLASASTVAGGVVAGDLWLLGRGDPTVTGGGAFGKSLPFRATGLKQLADNIVDAGVTRITGSVKGSTGYFARDWWATGWKDYFPTYYIALPSALTFDGNRAGGKHISDPELRAARSLTKKLRKAGVTVEGGPGMGPAPGGLVEVARVSSAPFEKILRHMNRASSNFFAEVLGKRASVAHRGAPGKISKGAAEIERYGSDRNVSISAYDSSGLSNANRISARGLTRLLDDADDQTWGAVLRRTLPTGGQGTLEKRLRSVKVRAKTGTLIGHSALSGYVWLERSEAWAPFAIISSGMAKSDASAIEDKIVRILTERAR